MATQDDLLRALRLLHDKGYTVVSAATVAEVLWPNGRTHNSNGQVFYLSAGIAGRLLRKCHAVVEGPPRQWAIKSEYERKAMIGAAGFGQAPNTGVSRGLSASKREPHERGAPLECPLCGAVRNPRAMRRDGSVTYTCPPDHVNHGTMYTWRIDVDGNLID